MEKSALRTRSHAGIIAAFAAITVIALAVCLGGCASSNPIQSDEPSTETVAPGPNTDPGQTAVLDGNILVEIALDYSSGTGFEWTCTVDDESVLGLGDSWTDSASDTDEPVSGGPIRDHFLLWSVGPGTATVTCELVRPWEDSEPAETVTYVFSVDENQQITYLPDESDIGSQNPPEFVSLS